MKRNFYLMLVFVMFFTSCQTKKEPAAVNPEAVKLEVNKMLNGLDSVLKTKDVETLLTYYTDDAVFCGTDPSEIWDKTAYGKGMTDMLSDTVSKFNFKIEVGTIQVDKGGTSVNVTRHFIPGWSDPLPVRETMHLIKTDNKWLIDFTSFGFVPLNADIPKLMEVLKK